MTTTQTPQRPAEKVERVARPIPIAEPLRKRNRRTLAAWMVSILIVVVAVAGAVIGITSDSDTVAADFGSGESVYAEFDWYADLEGFYLVPPAPMPAGESAYAGFGWAYNMSGAYLPPPAAVGMGENVYAGLTWYDGMTMYLPPPFSAVTPVVGNAPGTPSPLESIAPDAMAGGYDYATGTFVPPGLTQGQQADADRLTGLARTYGG